MVKFGKPAKPAWGKGKSKGGGGGQWMFVPSGGMPQMMSMPWGKGMSMPGKTLSKKEMDKKKTIEKLQKVDNSCKVWVGGLSKKVTWKALEKHFESVAKPKVTDISEKKGTGVVAFKTAEDAETAIATLNGSELEGETIEVDAWVKGEKDETKPKKTKTKKKAGKTAQAPSAKKKTDPKVAEKLKNLDPTCKVWVGGLSEKTTWKALEKHFEEGFSKPVVTEIMRKGMACVGYESAADAESAIAAMSGSELDGNTIETDSWVKPEKKPKKE
mmetsp:Transcript_46199/g.81286  ORF Transcript_46199/g.81286 Transcript_46199/m.81286 type:complete len:271 (-) Transcript_46199:189-1001(-)